MADLDYIAKLACDHYKSLGKQGKPNDKQWTTMSSIVQATCVLSNSDKVPDYSYKVIALGTGTKCLGKNELSPLGDLVSDSHAEVITRRAFLLYLYSQLHACDDKSTSIFDKTESTHSFSLKENISFHLFVSHLPCGDSAVIINKSSSLEKDIFAQQGELEPPLKVAKLEEHSSPTLQQHSRTGAKLQVGSKLYEESQQEGKCRVKPGKGDPTLCMSCSDKLAKWQLLGLQGSLLNNFIKQPIRLSSVIIGSGVPYSHSSATRALFTRVKTSIDSQKLSVPIPNYNEYICPVVVQSNVNFCDYDTSRYQPAPTSIIWYHNGTDKGGFQVCVNGRKHGVTKRNFGKPASQVDICRRIIFKKFLTLRSSLNTVDLSQDNTVSDSWSYDRVKTVNKEYNDVWCELKKHVFVGWTEKPDYLKKFCGDS